jgi:hypothetical protein
MYLPLSWRSLVDLCPPCALPQARRALLTAVVLACVGVFGSDRAFAASVVSPNSLGVNFWESPPDLATASAAGVGVARVEVSAGGNTDPVVELTAAAHLRLYPMLGLPVSNGPVADAAAMALYVTSFAERYGPGGSFWAQHPELPYLPVESYEIGNEPDITPSAPNDSTSLHYVDPASYALVYEAARTALHLVDPSGQAVVGGMLDSGDISLADAEHYLNAIGPMDAVGFHPYLYDITAMEQDTLALRQWLNANGHADVPLDINEFGASSQLTGWGTQVADYTAWALCTPALDVEDVQPFWWGGIPVVPATLSGWYPLVRTDLTLTPLGTAYLDEATALTTQGCPAVVTTTYLAGGNLHARYHAALTAQGAITPYSWTVRGLPKGLTVSSSGIISGRPRRAGLFNLNIAFTDPTATHHTTGTTELPLQIEAPKRDHHAKKPRRRAAPRFVRDGERLS